MSADDNAKIDLDNGVPGSSSLSSVPWVAEVRRETGLVELVCKHGVGHPSPGSVHWMRMHKKEGFDVHGCDLCCQTDEWRRAAAIRSYEVANTLIKRFIKERNEAFGKFMFEHTQRCVAAATATQLKKEILCLKAKLNAKLKQKNASKSKSSQSRPSSSRKCTRTRKRGSAISSRT